ncbi:MAG: hypothetical protein WCB46_12700 [Methanoregula sp.]
MKIRLAQKCGIPRARACPLRPAAGRQESSTGPTSIDCPPSSSGAEVTR